MQQDLQKPRSSRTAKGQRTTRTSHRAYSRTSTGQLSSSQFLCRLPFLQLTLSLDLGHSRFDKRDQATCQHWYMRGGIIASSTPLHCSRRLAGGAAVCVMASLVGTFECAGGHVRLTQIRWFMLGYLLHAGVHARTLGMHASGWLDDQGTAHLAIFGRRYSPSDFLWRSRRLTERATTAFVDVTPQSGSVTSWAGDC